eukprot:g28725.t1
MLRLSERLRSWAEAQAANPDLKGVTIVISCDRDPELLLEGGSQPAVEDYEMLSIVALRAWLCSQFPDCIPHRLLADFVAMCCLVGNDFLPHMAALDIYDGGLDKLLAAYYQLRPAQHGYLTREDLTLELPRWSGLLEQQGCQVRSVHRLKEYKGSSWLVHFSDAQSAVNTIVSTRRIEGRRLEVAWAKPSSLQLEELPEPSTDPFQAQPLQVLRESFEYWLGPENLPNDAFLRRHVRKPKDRFVPLRVFAAFRRLKIWMQDLTQLADVLRSSEILEVMGEGREAMVRAKEDHSRKPEESKEQVQRQNDCLELLEAGRSVEAVQKLLPEYNARYSGPVATGSPPAEDAAAVQPGTYQTVRSFCERLLGFLPGSTEAWHSCRASNGFCIIMWKAALPGHGFIQHITRLCV